METLTRVTGILESIVWWWEENALVHQQLKERRPGK